jgi:hypothetical protein
VIDLKERRNNMIFLFIKLLAWILWKMKASVIVNVKIGYQKVQPKYDKMWRSAAYGTEIDQMCFHSWSRTQSCTVSREYGHITDKRVRWPLLTKAYLKNKVPGTFVVPHPVYTGLVPRGGI